MSLAAARTTWRHSPAVWWFRRRLDALHRHTSESEPTLLITLATLTVLLGAASANGWVPLSAFVIPVVIGGVTLSVRRLLALMLVVGVALVLSTAAIDFSPLRVLSIVIIVIAGLLMLWNARSRSELGVVGSRGESMLVDLRDQLHGQGELPALPSGWYADAALRSADRASFAGDFMVASTTQEGRTLEVAVVDVSGKGINAGTRALVLSGALGGLLGSLPPAEFLSAANAYLLRRDWGEGFATAVHLVLDLRTGSFELRSAGHPPAVQLNAGSGTWMVQAAAGPILGLLERAEFQVSRGRLNHGDAMLLYTDGLVESPEHDIGLGIDRLLGEAERLVTRGFSGGAARLIDRMPSKNDDRALVLLHRA